MKLVLLTVSLFCVKEAFTQIQLNNGEFTVSHPKKGNWFQAYKDCRSHGQRLTKISDPEMLLKVQNLIDDLDINIKFNSIKTAIWTSINDLGCEGYFYAWNEEITRISTNEWNFIKANSNFPKETPLENCLAIIRNRKNILNFQDISCGNSTGYYLCERIPKNEECEKFALEKFKDCNCNRVDDWEKIIADSLGLE